MDRLGGLFGMLLIAASICMVHSFICMALMIDGDF